MSAKTIKTGLMRRTVELDRAQMKEDRTLEMSFSSEAEVKRWWGNEILDHDPKSVRLDRLNGGAALLVNHNPDDQIGVVESARVDRDKTGRAKVRFGTSARANEIFEDVKNGIRRLASVGYRIHEMANESVKEGVETMRVLDWEPFELSIVPIPADPSVGIGRNQDGGEEYETVIRNYRDPQPADGGGGTKPTAPAGPTVDVELVRSETIKAERKRVEEIQGIASASSKWNPKVNELAKRAVLEGIGVEAFRAQVLDAVNNAKPLQTPDLSTPVGLSDKEIKSFSLVRAMKASMNRENCFELEVSQEYSRRSGQQPRSFFIPPDILNARWMVSQRDMLVGTATAGGNLVADEMHPERFIDLLRTRMLVARLGATVLTGLNGDFVIPRQSASTTAYWVTEAQATTESNITVDQVTLTPRAVTALQEYSKNLLLQSSVDVENLIRNDLIAVLSRAVDLASLHGTGSAGQPTGIAATSGIGSVTGGANGAAPTWGNIVSLETEVAVDNADIGSLAYLSNAKVRGKLKQTEKATNTGMFVWQDITQPSEFGMLNGYRAGVSNQVASNLTKGTSTTVASAIFFGNWADLLIGQWNAVDILIDPYTAASTRLFKMYADIYVDIAVRHPESFSAMLDALTT